MTSGGDLAPTKIYYQFMKNSAGQDNMNVDGSASATTSTRFFISCPDGDELELHRAIITIYDTKGMQPEEYGDLGSSLSAGWEMLVLSADGTTLGDLTGGVPIKSNAQLAQVCYDVELMNLVNTTNATLKARWTFSKGGHPVYLKQGQRLEMHIKDDLTGLLSQRVMIQGHKL